MPKTDIFDVYSELYGSRQECEMSLRDYLSGCRDDKGMYASTAERMLEAIGEPELFDTSQDERMGRIFMNRTIKRYKISVNFMVWRRQSSV